MLNAHPDICSSSDSFQPILKEFRNEIARSLSYEIDPNTPFDDYYFDSKKISLMKKIGESDLHMSSERVDLKSLRQAIAKYASGYSPKIIPLSHEISGGTFSELFESGLKLVKEAYGDNKTSHICTKLVWTDEFIPVFLKTYPGMKILNIVRDPRAVCASRNAYSYKYPWLFLIRQWRKLATMSWLYCIRGYSFRDRALFIHYEELVKEPEKNARKICDFLRLDYHPKMVDAGNFIGGSGEPWQQNSTYYKDEKGLRAFNHESIDKWKMVLTKKEIEFIEHLCFYEMKLFGYQPLYATGEKFPTEFIFHPSMVLKEELAEWIRKYAMSEEETIRELALESVRFSSIGKGGEGDRVRDEDKERMFLHVDFFNTLTKNNGKSFV